MTVLEPMPERTDRRGWLRRAAFVTSALALTFAFAFSLSGIASTQGRVQPNGQAAALAAAQQSARGDDAADHRDCHRDGRSRSASGRV
jgi:hypothetical protein